MNNIHQKQSDFQKTSDLQIISDLQNSLLTTKPIEVENLFTSATSQLADENTKQWLVEFRGIFNSLEVSK